MKINHKKLNIVLGLVIVLMAGVFSYVQNSQKQIENNAEEVECFTKSEFEELQSRLKCKNKDIESNIVNGSMTKEDVEPIPKLKYKEGYFIEVEKMLSKNAYRKMLQSLPLDLERLTYKFNKHSVNLIISRNQMVGMRTTGDIVYVIMQYVDTDNKWEVVNEDVLILRISTNIKKHTRSNEEIKDIVNQLLIREGY